MAEKRMFAQSVLLSDKFLDLSMSARSLYIILGMVADDDGFVNSPKAVMRQAGCSECDMTELINNKFIVTFESGVLAICHWRVNNNLQKDRYRATNCQKEKSLMRINESRVYERVYTDCIQPTKTLDTQVSQGQSRSDKNRIGQSQKDCNKENFEKSEGDSTDLRPLTFDLFSNLDLNSLYDEYASSDVDKVVEKIKALAKIQNISNAYLMALKWLEKCPKKVKQVTVETKIYVPPKICPECGGSVDATGRCSKCSGLLIFDETDKSWKFHPPATKEQLAELDKLFKRF